jgi:50S ribosomal subunit-associated GTPase HflX
VDRTALILDIFDQHAHSSEGKAQVELAQLSYQLPRLRGHGTEMSRVGGGRVAGGAGIGVRGPGEMQLERQRRTLRRRMMTLRRELAQTARRSARTRTRRRGNRVPAVALARNGRGSTVRHSRPHGFVRITTVRGVLYEINARHQPELFVLDKVDVADPSHLTGLQSCYPDAVAVSALTGDGLSQLPTAIREALQPKQMRPALRAVGLDPTRPRRCRSRPPTWFDGPPSLAWSRPPSTVRVAVTSGRHTRASSRTSANVPGC